MWASADCLFIQRGPLDEDDPYRKSAILQQWLFGYELPDVVMLLRKDGEMWFLSTKKKCDFVRAAANDIPANSGIKKISFLLRNKSDANAANYETLWQASGLSEANGEKIKVGTIMKERKLNSESAGIVGPWEQKLTEASEGDGAKLELLDIAAGLGFVMSVKDTTELDLMKKSSVLSNKVMKHGCVKKMEEIIDSEQVVTNEGLAGFVEEILEDPSKIKLKVPKDDVQSCYYPIVQSGGTYDLRVSAQSSSDKLTHDIIIVSLGARYRNYCSNIARTFFVDPPKKVSDAYNVLLEMQEACLEVMKPGNQLKAVYKAAVQFLQNRKGYDYLLEHLPKNLGFVTGLDFREGALLLSPKNQAKFKQGMVFCLSMGFQKLELSDKDRSATPDKSPVS